MKLKIKIKPKLSYYISIIACFIILSYFAYKGIVAYLIHKELYEWIRYIGLIKSFYFWNNASFNAFIYSVYKNT